MTTSVVIAAYNGERFIEEQLNSIINQTVLPDEIIISDDGSQDNTVTICRDFALLHQDIPTLIKCVVNEKNEHGVVRNYENAISYATGDIVFFCDQDDCWRQNKIERAIQLMSSHKKKILIHDARVLKESEEGSFEVINKTLMPKFPFNDAGLYFLSKERELISAFLYCIINGMCIVADREYILSIMPFSKGFYHDQWVLFCGIADNEVMAVDEELALYRIHNNNTSGLRTFQRKRSFMEKIHAYKEKGKSSIRNYYVWFVDTVEYLGDVKPLDDLIRQRILFFTRERIESLCESKWKGTLQLCRAKRRGAYQSDGPTLFFHDLFYLWSEKRKNRKRFVLDLNRYKRPERSRVGSNGIDQ